MDRNMTSIMPRRPITGQYVGPLYPTASQIEHDAVRRSFASHAASLRAAAPVTEEEHAIPGTDGQPQDGLHSERPADGDEPPEQPPPDVQTTRSPRTVAPTPPLAKTIPKDAQTWGFTMDKPRHQCVIEGCPDGNPVWERHETAPRTQLMQHLMKRHDVQTIPPEALAPFEIEQCAWKCGKLFTSNKWKAKHEKTHTTDLRRAPIALERQRSRTAAVQMESWGRPSITHT